MVRIARGYHAAVAVTLTMTSGDRTVHHAPVATPVRFAVTDVVDKPAGLVTAPTPESDRGNLLDLLARRPGGGPVFLVHRIDLPTSGLLVFARTDLANRALGARFAAHDVERAYVAVVAGAVPA